MNQDTNDILSQDYEPAKLPTSLNVLTILTFIGCGLLGLYLLLIPVIIKWLSGFMDKALNSGQELSQKQLADIEKGKASLELLKANMIPIMIIGLAGIVLCLLGAIWMRKFKKDGFWLYVAGELAPLIAGFAIMGTAQFSGVMSYVFGIGLPVLFVILYAMQRKYLVK